MALPAPSLAHALLEVLLEAVSAPDSIAEVLRRMPAAPLLQRVTEEAASVAEVAPSVAVLQVAQVARSVAVLRMLQAQSVEVLQAAEVSRLE